MAYLKNTYAYVGIVDYLEKVKGACTGVLGTRTSKIVGFHVPGSSGGAI